MLFIGLFVLHRTLRKGLFRIRKIICLCLVILMPVFITGAARDPAYENREAENKIQSVQPVCIFLTPPPPYTPDEIDMITAVVMHEVGYCSRESKLAVANVVLNRLEDGRFGGSIYEILHEQGQFDAIHNYYDGEIIPDEDCRKAVMAALYGEDNSQGALYFCNMSILEDQAVIEWFHSLNLLFELDGQNFYQ